MKPDYSTYTLEELRDAQRHVDRNAYAERAREIDEEIRRREVEPLPQDHSSDTSRSNVPPWTTVVGILGIIFGVYGAGSHIETLSYPWSVSVYQQALEKAEEQLSDQRNSQAEQKAPLFWRTWDGIKQYADPPPWYKVYCVVTGTAGLVLVGTYISGGILLIRRRTIAVPLLIAATAGSLLVAVAKVIVFRFSFGFPLLMLLPSSVVNLAIHGGLLGGILTGNRALLASRSVDRAAT